jgi:simple sugar transport system permease protein
MKRIFRHIPLVATLLVFLVTVGAASARYPHFLSVDVFRDLLRDNAFLGIAAVGMTFVILTGGIDLSVGAVIGFTSNFVATLVENRHLSPAIVIPLALAIGSGFGAAMGGVIARYNLPPFLVTLAGMFLARGAGFITGLESIALTHPLYVSLGAQPLALPGLFLVVVVSGGLMLRYRPFGRTIYALGGNESSARLMGLPVDRAKVGVYALSGFCAALAGVAHGFYTASGNSSAGVGLELDAIAAVVIGGTLLTGGVGSLLGTFFGVLLLGVIQTIITFEGTLSTWWTKIVIGALLMLFIGLQRLIQSVRITA